jgi:hypothetical protein
VFRSKPLLRKISRPQKRRSKQAWVLHRLASLPPSLPACLLLHLCSLSVSAEEGSLGISLSLSPPQKTWVCVHFSRVPVTSKKIRTWMNDETDGWKASRKTATTSFTIRNMHNKQHIIYCNRWKHKLYVRHRLWAPNLLCEKNHILL